MPHETDTDPGPAVAATFQTVAGTSAANHKTGRAVSVASHKVRGTGYNTEVRPSGIERRPEDKASPAAHDGKAMMQRATTKKMQQNRIMTQGKSGKSGIQETYRE